VSRRRLRPHSASFYARDTVGVARALLGCVLESRIGGRHVTGRIVEVEAYIGAEDPADHGYGGRRTARNQALFGPPGTLYVFRSYGVHWCMNAVTEREGLPTAVLLRSLQPLSGLDVMAHRRGVTDPHRLCSGPGRLCQALGVTGEHDGARLDRGVLRIFPPPVRAEVEVVAGPRVGIRRAVDWPLRFTERGSHWVSRPVR
jgi:DNA-3-methyladenine glycosylase